MCAECVECLDEANACALGWREACADHGLQALGIGRRVTTFVLLQQCRRWWRVQIAQLDKDDRWRRRRGGLFLAKAQGQLVYKRLVDVAARSNSQEDERRRLFCLWQHGLPERLADLLHVMRRRGDVEGRGGRRWRCRLLQVLVYVLEVRIATGECDTVAVLEQAFADRQAIAAGADHHHSLACHSRRFHRRLHRFHFDYLCAAVVVRHFVFVVEKLTKKCIQLFNWFNLINVCSCIYNTCSTKNK